MAMKIRVWLGFQPPAAGTAWYKPSLPGNPTLPRPSLFCISPQPTNQLFKFYFTVYSMSTYNCVVHFLGALSLGLLGIVYTLKKIMKTAN